MNDEVRQDTHDLRDDLQDLVLDLVIKHHKVYP